MGKQKIACMSWLAFFTVFSAAYAQETSSERNKPHDELMDCFCSISIAQENSAQKDDWMLGVVLKLEKLKEKAIADIRKFEAELQKNDREIKITENLLNLALQRGNAEAEKIGRESLSKKRETKKLNEEYSESAEQRKKMVENALASLKAGEKDLEAELEQIDFMDDPAAWLEGQRKLIQLRLKQPSQLLKDVLESLGKMETLPPMKFSALAPGDVLLINREPGLSTAINISDDLLTGNLYFSSRASHTVSFLKEVKGRKLFLDNQLEFGPRIIDEEQFLKLYGARGAVVAKVKTPLKPEEAKKLYDEARRMAMHNLPNYVPFINDFGVLGDNVVCSVSSWKLLREAGRDIPTTRYWIKKWAVEFSPADFFENGQHFIMCDINLNSAK